MSAMVSVPTVARIAANVFKESVRDKVLYSIVLFAVIVILASLLLGQLSAVADRPPADAEVADHEAPGLRHLVLEPQRRVHHGEVEQGQAGEHRAHHERHGDHHVRQQKRPPGVAQPHLAAEVRA